MTGAGVDYIARALRETLDSIVSPELRERIVTTALQSAAMAQLPAQPALFRQFLEGPLRESLLRTLGAELGASVVNEMSSVVAAAERDWIVRSSRPAAGVGVGSGSPPPVTLPPLPRTPLAVLHPPDRGARPTPTLRSRADGASRTPLDRDPLEQHELRSSDPYDAQRCAPTEPAPATGPGDPRPPSSKDYPVGTANALGVIGTASVEPGSGRRTPLVLVVSTNPDLVRNFAAWLDPRATVQWVRGIGALIQDLGASNQRSLVIVFDARSPSLRPLSLAALADELPPGARVVLWGVAADVHATMLAVSGAVSQWLVCGTESSTSEVVAQCARLVG